MGGGPLVYPGEALGHGHPDHTEAVSQTTQHQQGHLPHWYRDISFLFVGHNLYEENKGLIGFSWRVFFFFGVNIMYKHVFWIFLAIHLGILGKI